MQASCKPPANQPTKHRLVAFDWVRWCKGTTWALNMTFTAGFETNHTFTSCMAKMAYC